jgi:hypothetical protein
VEERKGGFNRTIKIIVKNKIIKSSVKETWEDVIDDVIGNRNISDELDAALDQGKFFFAEMMEILNILALCNYL